MGQIEFILRALPNLLLGYPTERPGGLLLSLILGVIAVGIGFALGVPLGVARTSRRRWLRGPAAATIGVIRGLPLVLLLILVHTLGSRAMLGVNFAPLMSSIIALTLYASAYQAEIVRAGLRAVPGTQREAAQALGLNGPDTLRFVILPQALRAMLPAFAGQAISIFKDTSIVLALGVSDLMAVARTTGSASNERYFLALYATIGFLYFVVAYAISRFARRFERDAPARRMLWLRYQS